MTMMPAREDGPGASASSSHIDRNALKINLEGLAPSSPSMASPTAVISAANRNVDDSSIMADAITSLLERSDDPVAMPFDPQVDPCLRIVSICSSSDTTSKYAIPRLLDHYHRRHATTYDVHAQISHIIPSNKPAIILSVLGGSSSGVNGAGSAGSGISTTRLDHQKSKRGDYFSTDFREEAARLRKQMSQGVIYRSPPLSPEATPVGPSERSSLYGTDLFGAKNAAPPATPATPSLLEKYQYKIYHSFCPMTPGGYTRPIVPPQSCHFAINIHPLPTHTVPCFEAFTRSQFTELRPGGAMVICYPTSLKLYTDHVVPCLDIGLHQMLALNQISSQACEEISSLPDPSLIPSFDAQRACLESIPGASIEYSAHFEDYQCSNWGYRWFNEELDWLRGVVQRNDYSTGQTLMKLLEAMSKNSLWNSTGRTDIAVFVVRKVRSTSQ
uniref:ARAD1A17754p n=1 Tax=Blastobotrys adeninivorans TaxID=409370 RepID=A0A060T4I4_BLAAD